MRGVVVPLSRPRRLICDLLHFAAGVSGLQRILQKIQQRASQRLVIATQDSRGYAYVDAKVNVALGHLRLHDLHQLLHQLAELDALATDRRPAHERQHVLDHALQIL